MKTHVSRLVISTYSILVGLLFFAMQTSKLFRVETSELEMAEMPFGLFDWGFVWADTLVAGPMLLIGGIVLLFGNRQMFRLGGLLVFSGFTVNLYAMIFFVIGLNAMGHPMAVSEFVVNLIFTMLGLMCMISIAVDAIRNDT